MSQLEVSQDRYGVRRRPGRRLGVVLGAVLLVGILAWYLWTAVLWATPTVQSTLVSFGDVTDTSIRATLDIRKQPGIPVSCEVELTTARRLDTRQRFSLPADRRTSLQVDQVFQTERPVAVRLIGCTAPGQQRPR